MTSLKSFCFYLILTSLVSCSQKVSNQVVDGRLNDLLERRDYFKLRDELSKNESQLTEDRVLFFNAFVKKAFGERAGSNQDIEVLLEKYTPTLDDTSVVALLDAQAANYLHLYQYQKAAAIFEEILTKHAGTLDSAEAASYQNAKLLFGTFADTPPQKMHKPKDVSLASYRNQFNHLMTPVKVDTVQEDFIFDTGANLSTISESQALKMNLRIFEQSVEVGSSTQNEIQSKLAVADSFYVGEILFENVLFLVMPDDQLTFPEIAYTIKGIIGFPVIHQLGEVHLKKDGGIFVPKVASRKAAQNMFFEGLNPVVRAFSENDTLLFTFDTGAMATELSFKYYHDHQRDVEQKGAMQNNERGGAGGIVAVKEYMLPNFPLTIGTHPTSLDSIRVTLEEYDFNKYFDGNLGQDVLMKFNTLIINFEHLFIDFK